MQRVVIDIPDNKMDFFLELVHNLGFKKIKKLSLDKEEFAEQSKEEILNGLKEAVEEMNLVKQGKLKARPAKELLNEL